MKHLDDFTEAYFEAALWSSSDDEGAPLDAKYTIDDFAPETRNQMINDARGFQQDNRLAIEADDSPELRKHGRWAMAGHDFWLTRNRHGAGFEDGHWPKFGEVLARSARGFGEYDLYVGDDGLIYGSGGLPGLRTREARRSRGNEARRYRKPAPTHSRIIHPRVAEPMRKEQIHNALTVIHHTGRSPESVRAAILNHGLNETEINILLNAINVKRSELGPLTSQIPFKAREARIVADFNSLDALIDHARSEGATHISGDGAHTKLYFQRGGQYPYEEASVRRKEGYWHAQGPHARVGVERLPRDAKPLGRAQSRRAAEAPRARENTAVEDPFYIVQGLFEDGTILDEFGDDDEREAIRQATKMADAPWFEGDYVHVITRDGELVWDSREGRLKESKRS